MNNDSWNKLCFEFWILSFGRKSEEVMTNKTGESEKDEMTSTEQGQGRGDPENEAGERGD